MSQKNSIVEEALLSMQNLEEAIAENAKGILASTMKQEIKDLVKESLQESETEDEEKEQVDMETEPESEDSEEDSEEMEFDSEDSEEEESDEEDMETDFESDDDEDVDMDTDSDETIDLTGVSDEELIKVFKAMKDEDGIIVKKDGDSVHLQDDNADVEYMIKLGESELEQDLEMDESWEEEMDEEIDTESKSKVDDIMDTILNNESESIYELSFDDEDDFEMDDEESDDLEMDDEDDFEIDDEDALFESKKSMTIKPKGKNIGSPKFSYKQSKGGFKEDKPQGTRGVGMGKVKKSVFTQPVKKSEAKEGSIKPKGVGLGKGPKFEYKETTKGEMKKAETKEASRTLGSGKKWGRNGLDKPRTSPRHIQLETELASLREKNEEYRKALNIFREKLNEVAIFNSNLAYATRLFTEHTTTKQEKLNILRRFDGAESLKESKSLYKTIKNELGGQEKPMIKESIENKIEKVQQTGSSINLMESTTYQNPQFLRMKDLMSKLK